MLNEHLENCKKENCTACAKIRDLMEEVEILEREEVVHRPLYTKGGRFDEIFTADVEISGFKFITNDKDDKLNPYDEDVSFLLVNNGKETKEFIISLKNNEIIDNGTYNPGSAFIKRMDSMKAGRKFAFRNPKHNYLKLGSYEVLKILNELKF